ncbi:MAG: 3',5'-cyclic-nucleotide phosphodiesterase [Nitrospinota bacterium]|nr:MAG: 3',5'-cyclic-nucleotide phosphodiesterase [Nitrospinota bacterium]
MEVRVLGCSGGSVPGFELSSFLVDSELLLDAGSASAILSLEEQEKIRGLLLTHAHLDHIFGLSVILDNMMDMEGYTITVYSIPEVLQIVKHHVFNNHIWPDFTRIPSAHNPILRFEALQAGVETTIEEKKVLPIATNHGVPSVGYFVGTAEGTILYVGDSGPTEEIWQWARRIGNLRGIIMETSFPNRYQWLADISKHLTPYTLGKELQKLGDLDIPVLIYHLKPKYREEIIAELNALNDRRIVVLEQGKTYRF